MGRFKKHYAFKETECQECGKKFNEDDEAYLDWARKNKNGNKGMLLCPPCKENAPEIQNDNGERSFKLAELLNEIEDLKAIAAYHEARIKQLEGVELSPDESVF